MKSIVRILARLYPASWRARYGAEFDALLEDVQPSTRQALDVFLGAMSMQMTTWNFGKIMSGNVVDRGLEGVVVGETVLSNVEGQLGRLTYRGYDIHDLAVNATFEEIIHLLLYGHLPTHSELHDLNAKLVEARPLPSAMFAILHALPKDAWPMDVLRTALSALSEFIPHRTDGSHLSDADAAINLIAKTPVIVAAWDRIRRGLELPIFEDGLESRDFVHVSDVVEAFTLALESKEPVNDVLNVGTGTATPVRVLAAELSKALGHEPRLVITGQFRTGDIRHNFADLSKTAKLLGFAPRVDLTEGLRRFAAWVNEEPLPEDRLDQANRELQERKLMS